MVTGVVPSPPRYVPSFFVAHRVQHSHCSSVFIECSLLTLSRFPPIIFFMQEKFPTSMHSVRLEPAKLILVGTRTTYQATGDAGFPCPRKKWLGNTEHGTKGTITSSNQWLNGSSSLGLTVAVVRDKEANATKQWLAGSDLA